MMRRVLDVFDVGGVVLHPAIPVARRGGAGHGLLELLEGGGEFSTGELRSAHSAVFAPLHSIAGV